MGTPLRLCVYCGSRDGSRPAYLQAAERIGTSIGRRGWHMVYGGGRVGLMGRVADAALYAAPVVVTIANQRALVRFEKTPVDVRYVAQQRKNVLTVPVSALLALAEGGYGLEVAGRIVPVETGMVAGGQVEVRGAGIDQGVPVGVPE